MRRSGDHAMKSISTKSDSSQPAADTAVYLFDDWFDPIEAGVRDRVREFIQAMVEGELDATPHLHLHAPAANPVAKRRNNERDRASARRVQAADDRPDPPKG